MGRSSLPVRRLSPVYFALLATVASAACTNAPEGGTPPPGPVGVCSVGAGGAANTVGSFRVEARADDGANRLVVRNAATGAVVLSSNDGVPFFAAGNGGITAKESSGSFVITETVSALCEVGRIETVACDGDTLVVGGALAGASSCPRFELRLGEPAAGRLAFHAAASDPAYSYVELRYASTADESFYGFGEQYTYPDLKGHVVPVLAQEQGIGRGDATLTPAVEAFRPGASGTPLSTYVASPLYVSSNVQALYLATDAYAVFDLHAADETRIRLFAGSLDGGLVVADTPTTLLERVTDVTGRMPELPAWVHDGAIVGLQGGTDRVRTVLRQMQAPARPSPRSGCKTGSAVATRRSEANCGGTGSSTRRSTPAGPPS